jgi:uncharacterized coiled-coil protein SlyX
MSETVSIADPTMAIIIGVVLFGLMLLIVLVRRTTPAPAVPASATEKLVAIETRLTAVEHKVGTTEQSMHMLERSIASLPTQRSVHDLEKQVIALSGDMKAMAQESRATAAGVGRIEEFLFKASADALFPARNSDGSPSR